MQTKIGRENPRGKNSKRGSVQTSGRKEKEAVFWPKDENGRVKGRREVV